MESARADGAKICTWQTCSRGPVPGGRDRFPYVVYASLLSGTGPRREGPVAPRLRAVASARQPVPRPEGPVPEHVRLRRSLWDRSQAGRDRSPSVKFAQAGWVMLERLESLRIMLFYGLRFEMCRSRPSLNRARIQMRLEHSQWVDAPMILLLSDIGDRIGV